MAEGEMSRDRQTSSTLQGVQQETILLIDDEEPVQQIVRDILARRGYRVLVACDGPEALAASQDFSGPIHLVLTDVVMPRMHGWDVARSLAVQRPAIKILFISGYPENTLFQRGPNLLGRHFLQKPFLANTLVHKIRQVLDDPLDRS
jgi:two-component system, cell cycle sensor histidine kinase and response regulator CckA